MSLKGKKALVTGASKGIGLAVAEKLLREGCEVAVSARTEGELKEQAERLARETGGRVLARTCDVGEARQVRRLMEFCRQELGGLQVLINNAGIGIFRPVQDLAVEDWDRTIATNLSGVFYCCHYALPMLKLSGGFIINISSLAGKNAFPGGAAYNASKFALTGFSEALMQEVRHDDVRVAYVMPGSVNTWFRGSTPSEEESWKLAAEDVAEVVVDTLKRDPRCLTSRIEMRPSKPPQ